MPKKIDKKSTPTQAEKDALRKLKDAGLYSPKKPRTFTDYAKGLLKKFSDVITGTAKAIKTPRATAAKYRDPSHGPGTVRAKGTRVVVPIQRGETASYSPKTGEVSVKRKVGGDTYERKPFPKTPTSFNSIRDQLGENDRVVIPIFRGKNRPVEWQSFDLDAFEQFWSGGYGQREINGNVTDFRARLRKHIQIFHFSGVSAPRPAVPEMSRTETRTARRTARMERVAEIFNRVVGRRK